MVLGVHIAIFVALTDLQKVRRIGHAFHAANNDDVGIAGSNRLTAHDRCLQA